MNILVISPVSIIGEMIIKGIARGFEALGQKVLVFDVREIDQAKVLEFQPDLVFGLGYYNLIFEEAGNFIKKLNIPYVHYFIDDPNSVFANNGKIELLEEFNKQQNTTVFCWDEKYLSDFKAEAHYLPTGIDFELYKQDYPELDIRPAKILFAGRPLTDRRESIIAEVVKNFPGTLDIYSYPKHFDKSVDEMLEKNYLTASEIEDYKKCFKGFLRDEKELAAAYHRADIILNITLEQGFSSMNSRVLEALATKSFLISDYIEDTAKYFENGKDLILYKNTDELLEAIAKYLNDDAAKNKIRGNAVEKIKKHHTLLSKAEAILKVVTDS